MLVEIPDNIFSEVRNEAQGIIHGAVYLQIHFRDSKVMYYKTNREKSNSVTLAKTEGEQCAIKSYNDNHSRMRKGNEK
jgi:hypothetical protein